MFKPKNTKSWSNDPLMLKDFMYHDVVMWLDKKIKRFLLDYQNIKYFTQDYGVDNLSDYSYLITPAFKALEGTLLQIGKELGFDLSKYKYRVGGIFSDETLDKYYRDVLDKIKHLTEANRVDVKQWLDNARRILKSLRHTPAHFDAEVKPNWDKAFLSGDLIMSTISEMCHTLIQNKMFPSIVKAAEEKRKREGRTIIGEIN